MTIRSTSHHRPSVRRRSGRALVAVLLATAISTPVVGTITAGGDGRSTSRAASARRIACPGLPAGLALTGSRPHRVLRITRSGSRPLTAVSRGVVTKAVRGRDGTLWVETRLVDRPNGDWRRIMRVNPDGSRRRSETGEVELSHVGTLRGRTTVVTYIDRDDVIDPDLERYGHVYVEFSTGARRSVTFAEEIVNVVKSAAPAVHRARSGRMKRVVVLHRVVDAPDDFTYHRLHGDAVRGLFDPNDDAPYFGPPTFDQPILSPRGVRLSWTEGPDWDHDRDRLVGNWRLVVANSRTGAESVRVRVGSLGEMLHHADYDGRYWVGTFSRSMYRAPRPGELRIRVIDTRAAHPRVIDPACSAGFVASIDRFARQ
jgi:hypothetical protein